MSGVLAANLTANTIMVISSTALMPIKITVTSFQGRFGFFSSSGLRFACLCQMKINFIKHIYIMALSSISGLGGIKIIK